MYFKVYDDDVPLQRSSKSQQSNISKRCQSSNLRRQADAMPETREGMTASFVVFVFILFLYPLSYLLSFCFFYYYSGLKHGLHLRKLSLNGFFPCQSLHSMMVNDYFCLLSIDSNYCTSWRENWQHIQIKFWRATWNKILILLLLYCYAQVCYFVVDFVFLLFLLSSVSSSVILFLSVY